MDAIDELQRTLGAPVVALAQQFWPYIALAVIGVVLWSFGVSRRQYIRNGLTIFPDRNGRSRGFEEMLGLGRRNRDDDDADDGDDD